MNNLWIRIDSLGDHFISYTDTRNLAREVLKSHRPQACSSFLKSRLTLGDCKGTSNRHIIYSIIRYVPSLMQPLTVMDEKRLIRNEIPVNASLQIRSLSSVSLSRNNSILN